MHLLSTSSQRKERRVWMMLAVSLLVLAGVVIGHISWSVTPAAESSSAVPAPAALSDDNTIARLQETLQQNPENSHAYARLGLAYLQKVRLTADPALYTQAELAFNEALKRDPVQLDALFGQGILALARHDFQGALAWGEQARQINPYRADILGILLDAQVELGQYEAAVATTQRMVNMRPDLTSYSRVSYIRELHGDVAGAIEAMETAVAAGVPGQEETLWAQTQLGDLYFNSGDLVRAEVTYQEALRLQPDYVYAEAGLARIDAAHGDYAKAIREYRGIVERLPLPAFVIALGDLYALTGHTNEAQQQYELVDALQQLNASAGMAVDMELALFEADRGIDPAGTAARARTAYDRRPGIYAADVLAWALYQSGDYEEAAVYSQEALRLNTRDALLYFHAGMIAAAQGDDQQAETFLVTALAINPHFHPIQAQTAQARLAELRRVNP